MGRHTKSEDGPRTYISVGFTAKELSRLKNKAAAAAQPLQDYLRRKCLDYHSYSERQ